MDAWRKIAQSKGPRAVPSSDDIDIEHFGRFLARTMIVCWDFDTPDLFIKFSGRDMTDFFHLNERGSPLKSFFETPEMLVRHAEVARRVTTELLAAEMTSELTTPDGARTIFTQLRLPLESEDGHPMVLSVFHLEEFPREPSAEPENAGVKIIEHRFIRLFDDQGKAITETAPDFWFESRRTIN